MQTKWPLLLIIHYGLAFHHLLRGPCVVRPFIPRQRAVLGIPGRPVAKRAPSMSLSKVSLHFDFDRIPYAAGIQHIHSPEHISETHRLGAPFFKVESVDAPRLGSNKQASVSFVCSTLFIKNMQVRMFSNQPNESNMLFFKDRRALYGVKFTVIPTKVRVAFARLCGDLIKDMARPSCPTAFASTSRSSQAAA